MRLIAPLAVKTGLHRGFTLIELMIALAILALLTMLAVPMYGEMLANSEVRNATENILMGLRTAQGEAVKLNAPAKFVMDTAGWNVYVTDPDSNDFSATAWRTYQFIEGGKRATASPASAEVTFNGLGQIILNADAVATPARIDVTTSSISSPRNLAILVGTKLAAAGMKMCDPKYDPTDPMGCPTL